MQTVAASSVLPRMPGTLLADHSWSPLAAGCPQAEVIKSCRFLGCAEMALSDTWLSSLKIWLPLMRCDAGDIVRWAPRRKGSHDPHYVQ